MCRRYGIRPWELRHLSPEDWTFTMCIYEAGCLEDHKRMSRRGDDSMLFPVVIVGSL